MRRITLFSLLALFSFSIFSQIPNYVPTNGLNHYFGFNNYSLTNMVVIVLLC